MELHHTATGCHLPQSYLSADTRECHLLNHTQTGRHSISSKKLILMHSKTE